MADFIDNLTDCAPDTITAQSGTVSAHGTWTTDGSAPQTFTEVCKVSDGKVRLVRNSAGEEVASSIKVTILSVPASPYLNARLFRFTIPARYDPNTDLEALAVKMPSDESGPTHYVVWFR